ncbi:hypothetical protein EW026_g8394 [Hermanssonia centrifuga]|uniref:Uncharacterized protein n=1 Tax=Hermanssonia centrifuga TaxID=98765 RepID=A0A4S4K5Z6_9APHY|nr:hypothetical protein EW026_g8394 [Hermanssonia centrifuga]
MDPTSTVPRRRSIQDPTQVIAWDAFIHFKLQSINKGRLKGTRERLSGLLKFHQTELQEEWEKLTTREKKQMKEEYDKKKAEEENLEKTVTPKALMKKVDGQFEKMEQEWTAVCRSTGVEGFYIGVRSSIEEYHTPKAFFTPRAETFVKKVLGMEPEALALKLEAFVTTGLADQDKSSAPADTLLKGKKLISKCRTLIQEGLNTILKTKGITHEVLMNYINYERKIVEQHGVELQGWPCKKFVNPGDVKGRQELEKLFHALHTKTCAWKPLSAGELEERQCRNRERQAAGEVIYKPRKKPAPKKGKQPKSAMFIHDSEEEQEEQEEQDKDSKSGREVEQRETEPQIEEEQQMEGTSADIVPTGNEHSS